jgi:CheY-like chemotaxis protein
MNDMTGGRLLAGRAILVVEDQYVIAEELVRMLERLGARVIGPFAQASAMAADASGMAASASGGAGGGLDGVPRPDAALLDIHLPGRPVFELADRLRAAGVPLLFLTGYDAAILPPAWRDGPWLSKPVDPRRLAAALAALLGLDGGGEG